MIRTCLRRDRWSCSCVRRSRTGIRLLAIKGDETAALSLGIASARLKLALFCGSAAIAGAAGAVHGLFTASLYPDVVFSVDVSLTALAVPLIGGVATVSGPVLGAHLLRRRRRTAGDLCAELPCSLRSA